MEVLEAALPAIQDGLVFSNHHRGIFLSGVFWGSMIEYVPELNDGEEVMLPANELIVEFVDRCRIQLPALDFVIEPCDEFDDVMHVTITPKP